MPPHGDETCPEWGAAVGPAQEINLIRRRHQQRTEWHRRGGRPPDGGGDVVRPAHRSALAGPARALRPVKVGVHAVLSLVQVRSMGALVPAIALSRLGPDPQSGLLACQGARRRGQSRWGPVASSHGSDQRRPQHQGGRDGRRPRAAGAVGCGARAAARLACPCPFPAEPARLLADRGFDADDFRRTLGDQGVWICIPPRSGRRWRAASATAVTGSATPSRTFSPGSNVTAVLLPATKNSRTIISISCFSPRSSIGSSWGFEDTP